MEPAFEIRLTNSEFIKSMYAYMVRHMKAYLAFAEGQKIRFSPMDAFYAMFHLFGNAAIAAGKSSSAEEEEGDPLFYAAVVEMVKDHLKVKPEVFEWYVVIGDYSYEKEGTLTIAHGPMTFLEACAFYAGSTYVNDSDLEIQKPRRMTPAQLEEVEVHKVTYQTEETSGQEDTDTQDQEEGQ